MGFKLDEDGVSGTGVKRLCAPSGMVLEGNNVASVGKELSAEP